MRAADLTHISNEAPYKDCPSLTLITLATSLQRPGYIDLLADLGADVMS